MFTVNILILDGPSAEAERNNGSSFQKMPLRAFWNKARRDLWIWSPNGAYKGFDVCQHIDANGRDVLAVIVSKAHEGLLPARTLSSQHLCCWANSRYTVFAG